MKNKRKQQERNYLLGAIAVFIFVATAIIFLVLALFCKEYFSKVMSVNLPIITVLLIACVIFIAGFITCKIKYDNRISELNDEISKLKNELTSNHCIRTAKQALVIAEAELPPKSTPRRKSKNIEYIF